MSDFYNQGAVPLSSSAYIPRAFETTVFQEITAGRWVLLLGPRQHGKSTGLVRLKGQFREAGFAAACVDLQGLQPCGTFPELLREVANQLAISLGQDLQSPDEGNIGDISAWLEQAFPKSPQPIVVIIDEAGSIDNTEFRNAFYGQIRQLSSQRADAGPESIATRIRFVFAGTFRPESLVQERNSPFNVCVNVETDDVSIDQAKALAERVHPDFVQFVQRAHAELNGQPYLLQTLFQEMTRSADKPLEMSFTEALSDCPRLVSGHLEGIFSKVIGNPGLSLKVAGMVQLGYTNLIPADSDCSFLQVLGLAKRQGARLIFRNVLYEKVAKLSPQIQPQAPSQPKPQHLRVFGIQSSDLAFMTNADLRTLCFSGYDGAAKAHGNGNYRLALIGFGSAMEALLIDFLTGLTSSALNTAVAAAQADREPAKRPTFDTRFEDRTIPMTWRLVNLIKVAKQTKVKGITPDPNDTLREWRNLVHPAVAIHNFVDESQLEPDSVAASALFTMLLRDLTP